MFVSTVVALCRQVGFLGTAFSVHIMDGDLMVQENAKEFLLLEKILKYQKEPKLTPTQQRKSMVWFFVFEATYQKNKDVRYLRSRNTIGKIGEPQHSIFSLILIINALLRMELMGLTTNLFTLLMGFLVRTKTTSHRPLI